MTRYCYTDPLAAAWMAKHFGMKFYWESKDKKHRIDYERAEQILLECFDVQISGYGMSMDKSIELDRGLFYIHPDSVKLLEAQEGDMIAFQGETFAGAEVYMAADHTAIDFDPKEGTKIIQRNGIAFIWPEVENG